MGSQRVRHDLAIKQQQQILKKKVDLLKFSPRTQKRYLSFFLGKFIGCEFKQSK